MAETKYLTFTNPATGEKFGQVDMGTTEDVRQAMDEMRRAAVEWRRKPVKERVRILGKFQEVLLDSMDEITDVLNKDTGKSRQDAMFEVIMSVDLLANYRKYAPRWLRRKGIPRGLYFFKKFYMEREPYGVVLVISPWNYPFYLAIPPVIAALLAGNTVVLKPSEVAAASGVMMEKMLCKVPEICPYIRVLHGDGEVGATAVQSSPDYIFVTGSPLTGRKIMQAAAENYTPVACELGGKDAVIVLDDADIAAAAKWVVWGAYFNTGQTCMAVERVYVVESRYDEFVRLAVEETGRMKIGYTNEKESPFYLGPMSDPRQLKILEQHLKDAQVKGARIVTGGDRKDMYVQPMVVLDVDHSMLLMTEETFGPFLPIMKVKDEAEAIRLANDSNYGLGGSVWSNDIQRAERVAHQLHAGSILINDTITQIAVPMLPFGGLKRSGYGRIHGEEGLLQFTQTRAYGVGRKPVPYDIAVVLRKPGHYWLGGAIWRLVYGMNFRQRWQGLKELVRGSRKVASDEMPGKGRPVVVPFGVKSLEGGDQATTPHT